MERESMSLRMEAIMMDSGKITRLMELVNFIFPTKNYSTLANGIMMNLVGGELNMQKKSRIGRSMKGSFRME